MIDFSTACNIAKREIEDRGFRLAYAFDLPDAWAFRYEDKSGKDLIESTLLMVNKQTGTPFYPTVRKYLLLLDYLKAAQQIKITV